MRSYHARFYIPILLLWGAVVISTLEPVVILSDIRFDPEIERNDLLRIDPGGDVGLDSLAIYRINGFDYVSRVIGLAGDEIVIGLDGSSIVRNGERVPVAPRGFRISTVDSGGVLNVAPGQVAVYVHDGRRSPVAVAIDQAAIRGPIETVLSYSDLGRSDWMVVGLYTAVVLALVLLPYVAFLQQHTRTFLRLVILVSHTFLVMVTGAGLVAASLPGDPMQVGITEPLWWWFPLSVVSGFRLELLFVVGGFLATQWVLINRPWKLLIARNS